MKKGVLASYFEGIVDIAHGESYSNILKYFLPEFIASLVLYSALYLVDVRFIADLESTTSYATLGVTNLIMHFITKIAEGLSVGAIIMCGQYNGANNFQKVGRTLIDTFWVTFIAGLIISSILFFGGYWIYYFMNFPDKMIIVGISYLKIRALGIFFMFIYFAFISFLKGIKNTQIPMLVYFLGGVVFVFFDYALIFGKLGLPCMKLNGSAMATSIQYGFMLVLVASMILRDKEYRKYSIKLFSSINVTTIKKLLFLSWPVIIDKTTIALSYIWLCKMITPIGKCAIAAFLVIKDMERLAFIPAIAFAQIITFLVSNDFGAANLDGIKNNIKKVLLLAFIFVFLIVFILSLNPKYFISFFDKKAVFTDFAAKAFPILSVLLFFDLIQLILSAALRGVGDVKIVMWTRMLICFGGFFPLSYLISNMQIDNDIMKFILVYAIFYIGNAFMSIIYINRFRTYVWKSSTTKVAYDKNY